MSGALNMHPAMVAESVHVPLPSPLAAVSNKPTGALMVWVVRS
jgi:hypothetical protein